MRIFQLLLQKINCSSKNLLDHSQNRKVDQFFKNSLKINLINSSIFEKFNIIIEKIFKIFKKI